MRKIATSIAAIAVLFFASGAVAQDPYDREKDYNIKGEDTYVLRNHIGSNKGVSTLQSSLQDHGRNYKDGQMGGHDWRDGSRLGSVRLGTDGQYHGEDDCFLSARIEQPHDCSCQHDDWGCGGGHAYAEEGHKPHNTAILGAENRLTATIVPAQLLLSNQTTTLTGNECQHSIGQRDKTETETFQSVGNFSVCKFDVQENCLSQASVFVSNGKGDATASAKEGEHPINACECHGISSQDYLDLDDSCDCRIFENKRKDVQDIADPEADVEERINFQIKQTIADVLSEIVQNVFHQSFEDVIQIE